MIAKIPLQMLQNFHHNWLNIHHFFGGQTDGRYATAERSITTRMAGQNLWLHVRQGR
jgi:hypothetical protein